MHRPSFSPKVVLALLLVSCGFVLAEQTPKKRPDPARFAKEIAKFDAEETSANPPARGGIVFTGSSSVRFWKVNEDYPDLPVLNRGFGGSVANDLSVYFEKVILRYQPKLLVVYTGGNDINAKLTVDEALADYTKFLNLVHEKLPNIRVIVNSVKYAEKRLTQMDSVRQLNVKLEAWCKAHEWTRWVEASAHLLDSAGKPRTAEIYREDKLHLNDKGYVEWNAIVGPVIREEWAKVKGS